MASLKTKILIFFMVSGLSLFGQSFTYSYIDPCTRDLKTIYIDQTTPIVVSYYGQVKSFTYSDLTTGVLDIWMNNIYNKYRTTSPCQGLVTTTTTTTSTNSTLNIISSVMGLTSMDFSSVANVGSSMSTNIGSTTNSGTNLETKNDDKGNNNTNADGTSNNNSSNGNSSSGNSSGNNNDNNQGQGGQVDDKGGNSTSSSGSTNSSGSSNSGSSNSNGSGNNKGTETKNETPKDQKTQETKTEEQKQVGTNAAKSTNKAKVDVQKPAILVTGDIVGIQNTNNSQDARFTTSFTRVKGDGTSSLGGSADYMINSKIGNFGFSLFTNLISSIPLRPGIDKSKMTADQSRSRTFSNTILPFEASPDT